MGADRMLSVVATIEISAGVERLRARRGRAVTELHELGLAAAARAIWNGEVTSEAYVGKLLARAPLTDGNRNLSAHCVVALGLQESFEICRADADRIQHADAMQLAARAEHGAAIGHGEDQVRRRRLHRYREMREESRRDRDDIGVPALRRVAPV